MDWLLEPHYHLYYTALWGNWKSRERETETGTGTGSGNGKGPPMVRKTA